jgi:hypothetical protein
MKLTGKGWAINATNIERSSGCQRCMLSSWRQGGGISFPAVV